MSARNIVAVADATELASVLRTLPGVAGIAFKRDDNTLGVLDPDTGTVTYSPIDLGVSAVKCAVVPISGAALHAANLTLWTAPAAAIIHRVLLDITTVATGAATIDIGYTAVSATTSSDTLLDGVDANAAIALFDSMNAALDSGANAKAQKAASGKWITADEASGDTTGMVATAYIYYSLV